jgi:2-oxoglutarate/2-oxoacid ferredoxin oxidoreductase subunit alpha
MNAPHDPGAARLAPGEPAQAAGDPAAAPAVGAATPTSGATAPAAGSLLKRPRPLAAVNDFVVKFANVNGSGSASANELFAKSILRMGVPVSPRNIFPSNIQGLPTWYEVRVTEKGWLGRRGGVDLLVAMNPQTWERDLKEIEPGGYLFYDSSKFIPASRFRDDITVLGMPLTEISNATYVDARERQLMKNIIYLGALSVLLGIDSAEIVRLFGEQYRGKERLLDSNVKALELGRDYASQCIDPIGLRVERRDAVGDRIFVEGNAAVALGAVYGGATVCAWYPITPSSSVAEAFTMWCQKYRNDKETGLAKYAIVQAEDELASIGMVVGAGWNGARAFTATSGPGVSLMTEFIGLAYFAEIPVTIVNVQRGGPSTGMPTRTQQADLLACAYASHGDTRHVLLLPEDPAECFEHTAAALDLADRLQTPVFVMTDLDIGMNTRLCKPFQWDDSRSFDRGKVMTHDELEAGKDFGRYLDVDGDGVPYRTYPGTHPTRGAFFTRGTTRNAYAKYSEAGPDYVYNMERLLRKFETAKQLVPQPVIRRAQRTTRWGAIYFGSTSPAMDEALEVLEEHGVVLDTMRLRAFPFPDSVRDFILSHESVFVVEQNRDAQMKSMLVNELQVDPGRLVSVLHYDGTPITARFIIGRIAAATSNTVTARPARRRLAQAGGE